MSAEYIAYCGLIVAIVAALFTALQWASAYRSAESSERSAKASERSAVAAEDSASSTRALSELSQRPWLCLEPPSMLQVQTGDYRGWQITVRATLCNLGLTPAINVVATRSFGVWPVPFTEWPLNSGLPADAITLGPNLKLEMTTNPLYITNERLQEVADGRYILLFVGECTYRDVFNKDHKTLWCLQLYAGTTMFAAYNTNFNVMT